MRRLCLTILALSLAGLHPSSAQQLSLEEVVRRAATNYDGVVAERAQAAAAAAAVRVARTAYLPRVDAMAHLNQATTNNVAGLLFAPAAVIAPISGPALYSNSQRSVWGSQLGIVASWEPLDFGQHRASVAIAEASRRTAQASQARLEFEVSVAAADAYLTLVAAGQQVRIAEANLERARELERIVKALKDAGLRPGVEWVRAQAERVQAEVQVLEAKAAEQAASAPVAMYAGVDQVVASSRKLLSAPPVTATAAEHPEIEERRAAVAESDARLKALDVADRPRFIFQGLSSSRGTGVEADGSKRGWLYGAAPNIHNWGIGLTATLSLLDYKIVREKRAVEDRKREQAQARVRESESLLAMRKAQSRAAIQGAQAHASMIPVQIEAIRAAHQQATARYQSGLSNITELVETQRLLAEAEVQAALANLKIWRAWLMEASASGDIGPVLAAAKE
jgi:outer membrane protein TolC